MLCLIRNGWSTHWALIGLIAIASGCRPEAKPTAGNGLSPELSSSVAAEKLKRPPELTQQPQIEPGAVAEDGTVLLAPPEVSDNVASDKPAEESIDKQSENLAVTPADIILDPLPQPPADAQFGEPTLAGERILAGEPAQPAEPSQLNASGSLAPIVGNPPDIIPPQTESPNVLTLSDVAEEKFTVSSEANTAASPDEAVHAPLGNLATTDELNQKIAEDWPQPQAVLLLTGQQHGYLEPCGCTGLDRQKGGIIRRDTLLTQLRDKGWSVIPLDVGNQVRRTGRQAEIKFRVTANAFKAMNYKAVTLGFDDLHLNSAGLVQVAASDDVVKNPGMFISANTSIYDTSFWPTAQVVEVGGRKIGITAYLGEEYRGELMGNKDISVADPETSLKQVVAELKSKGCDYLVLLAHANQAASEQMAARVPGFDLVVTSGGLGEPRNVLDPIPGTSAVISQVGTKGMFACIVGLFDDATTPVRYQRIAISSQFKDSPRMLESFKQYQEVLQSEGFEGLGLRFKTAPKPGEFVGSEACGDCHSTAYEVWENSRHYHATDSIVSPPNDRGAIARHFDPECVSCHVTGWDPQKFEPFESGYWSLEKTPKLVGSGCENCHGPGSEHIAAEEDGSDSELLNRLREQMRLPLKQAEAKCVECHDTDNSPEFNFKEYWEEVKHIGKD